MVKGLSEQAAVTDWPLRLLLTAATAAVIVLALLQLRRGWRNRGRRQNWAGLPAVPAEPATAAGVTGKYVGTVRAGDWLDRVVAGGPMARSLVAPTATGLLLQRDGEEPLFLPGTDIEAVGTAPGMLQKVFGRHGVLTINWNWAGRPVVSGIWFPDPQDQRTAAQWVRGFVAAGVGNDTSKEGQA